eukprot:TRINITY_DN697_c0_g1_i2.p1 TRINITY_DN697_c0_g1~~TRINITY_DN697_c0_g1_i2.p1  ORF type:complete len:2102 (+),score=309.51 TRINITY_DN697_c0_g1_i2:581-6307(+)
MLDASSDPALTSVGTVDSAETIADTGLLRFCYSGIGVAVPFAEVPGVIEALNECKAVSCNSLPDYTIDTTAENPVCEIGAAPIGESPVFFGRSCSTSADELSGTVPGSIVNMPYGDSERRCWFVTCDASGYLELEFDSFSLEDGYDFLRVVNYDGSSHVSEDEYTGMNAPPFVGMNVNGESGFLIEFRSDGSVQEAGFRIGYSCQSGGLTGCPKGLAEEPTSSPVSHGPYGADEELCWKVSCDSITTLELTFTAIDTQDGVDLVTVREIDGLELSNAQVFSGTPNPLPSFSKTVLSPLQSGYLISFTSDGTDHRNGFTFSYSCESIIATPPQDINPSEGYCSMDPSYVDTGSGTISHFNYEDNQELCWFVTCPTQPSYLELTFTSFATEAMYDFVSVFEFNGNTHILTSPEPYSGYTIPPVTGMTVGDPSAGFLIKFKSDHVMVDAGFSVDYVCGGGATAPPASVNYAPYDDVCAGDPVAASNIHYSQDTAQYDSNTRKCWILSCPAGQHIKLTFQYFDVEEGWDFVRLHEVVPTSPKTILEIASLTGTTTPPVTLYGSDLVMVLTSDGSVEANGFSFSYACDSKGLDREFITITGEGDYSGEYELLDKGATPHTNEEYWVKVPPTGTYVPMYFLTYSTSNVWVLKSTYNNALFTWRNQQPGIHPSSLFSSDGDAPTVSMTVQPSTTNGATCFINDDCLPNFFYGNPYRDNGDASCLSSTCECSGSLVKSKLTGLCVCKSGFFFDSNQGVCMPVCTTERVATPKSMHCFQFETLRCQPNVVATDVATLDTACDGCSSNTDCFRDSGITSATCTDGVCSCGDNASFYSGYCHCAYDYTVQGACAVPPPVCSSNVLCFPPSTFQTTVYPVTDPVTHRPLENNDYLPNQYSPCGSGQCHCGSGTMELDPVTRLCKCREHFAFNPEAQHCMRQYTTCEGLSPKYQIQTCEEDKAYECASGYLPTYEGDCGGCYGIYDCLPRSFIYSSENFVNPNVNCSFQFDTGLSKCVCPDDMEWRANACVCKQGIMVNSGYCSNTFQCFDKTDCFAQATSVHIPLFETGIHEIQCVDNACMCGNYVEQNDIGMCICPYWQRWSEEDQDCIPTCYYAYDSTYETCAAVDDLVTCLEQYPRLPDGYCDRCDVDEDCSPDRSGQYPGIKCLENGQCECTEGKIFKYGSCRCPDGIVMTATGECPQCASNDECIAVGGFLMQGYTHDDAKCINNICTCTDGGELESVGNYCECKEGSYSTESGTCRVCTFASDCFVLEPIGEPYDQDRDVSCFQGKCYCGDGYESKDSKCVCGGSTYQDAYGLCQQCNVDEHCFTPEHWNLIKASGTFSDVSVCIFGRCVCGEDSPFIQDGHKCKLCESKKDCGAGPDQVRTCTPLIPQSNTGTCDCSGDYVKRHGVCQCADSTKNYNENTETCDSDRTCSSDIDCYDGDNTASVNGATCNHITGECECTGHTHKVGSKCICNEGLTLQDGHTCGFCNVADDCIVTTHGILEDNGVSCTNYFCKCQGDYKGDERLNEKCECKSGVMNTVNGVCIKDCKEHTDCQASILPDTVDPTGNIKCVNDKGDEPVGDETGFCVCGQKEAVYNSSFTRTENGLCKYEPFTGVTGDLTETVQRICSVDTDCISSSEENMSPVGTDVVCNFERGTCICSGDYELYAETICRPKGSTVVPTTSLSLSVLYSDKQCSEADHDQLIAAIRSVWAKIYNIADPEEIAVELKCGSIGVQARLKVLAELLKVNSRNAFRGLISSHDVLFQLGEPGTITAAAGTSLCPIQPPVKGAEMFLGVCQPTACIEPYTLIKQSNLDGVDICYDLFVTEQPAVARSLGKGADDIFFETIVVIVGCILIFLLICISIVLLFKYKSIKSSHYLPQGGDHHAEKEEEINQLKENNPDEGEDDDVVKGDA